MSHPNLPILSVALVVVAGLVVAGALATELAPEQGALYGAAKKHCAADQSLWEARRSTLQALLGGSSMPRDLQDLMVRQLVAYATVTEAGAALTECKGDSWLHFLTTPKLICEEEQPVGCTAPRVRGDAPR